MKARDQVYFSAVLKEGLDCLALMAAFNGHANVLFCKLGNIYLEHQYHNKMNHF